MARRKTDWRKRFERFIDRTGPGGCWMWRGTLGAGGYGYFCAPDPFGRRAHRISYALYRGPIPEGLYVCHHCDVCACVNPDHLFVGTAEDNARDRDAKGRHRASPHHPTGQKLIAEDVRALRALHARGLSMCGLGRLFGIHEKTVKDIVVRRYWKHVD
jgi:hypothetical protein